LTEINKNQLTSAAISMRVDGKPSFTLLMTKDGTVKRMGYSAVDNDEKTVASCQDSSIFERFLAGLPSDVLSQAGSHDATGAEGERVACRIELEGGPEPAAFEMSYYSESASLTRYMQLMVDLGEELTDEWYGSNLTLTAVDLAPMTPVPPPQASAPARVPPPAPAPLPAPLYEAPPAYEPPPEPEPAPVEETPEEAPNPASERPGGGGSERKGPPEAPKASKQRFAFAILLDVMVLVAVYNVVVLVFAPGGGLPIGAAFFFLILAEFCILQFLRRSPGYWLLGMSAGLGQFPRVDPAQLARESLVTHIVATVLLMSGIDGVTAWTEYQAPVPYFGLSWGTVFTALVSFLLGGALITAGVLIFRNDLRGVWVGGGGAAMSFLSVWFARGNVFNGWLRLELMAQRAAEGRPVEASELDGFLGMVMPMLLVITLVYLVGLYFAWRRLGGPARGLPV
jgi:hypothetical protein